MNLNYQEIMELPEPRDGTDVETMDSICGVYAQLVRKFTRLLAEARQVKICWLQQERIDLYAKRLAANQREYRCKKRQRRHGEMFNFCLRVREWVLSCTDRRLKIRNLIGEARIAKWHARKYAQNTELAQNPEFTQNPELPKNKESQFPPMPMSNRNWLANPQSDPYEIPSPNYNRTNTNRQEVGNWYHLPYIRKRCAGKNGPDAQGMALPAKNGMRRAIPSVVFWPAELALDYVHNGVQQIASENPVRKRPPPMIMKEQYPQENTETFPSHMGVHTAKEWPD